MNRLRRALLSILDDLQQAGVEVLPHVGVGNPLVPSAPPEDPLPSSRVAEEINTPLPPPSPTQPRPSAAFDPKNALFDMVDPHSRPATHAQAAENKSAAPTLEILAAEVATCTQCSELASTRTQTVFADGSPRSRLVFLGEAPGADEDRQGKPFVGRAGKLLTDIIEKGMKLRRSDVYIMNVLKCRPPGNRTPLPHETHNCRPFLLRQLELVDPEFVCCLGAVAAKNLLQTTQSIGKMRGRFFDLGGIRVMCTYHPAYLLRNPGAKHQTWEDIQMLMQAMQQP